jgi:hypothetical protein
MPPAAALPPGPRQHRPGQARRRGALLLVAGVAALHGVLLLALAPEQPGSARPSPAAAAPPAVWIRMLPQAADPPVAGVPALGSPVPAPATEPAAAPRTAPPASADAARTASADAISEPEASAVAAAEPDDGAASPAGVAPPRYATQLPGSAQLQFELRRGPHSGRAALRWQADAESYRLALHADLQDRPLLEQHSRGRIAEAGLVPQQFSDRRRARSAQSASFDEASDRIHFSGRAPDLPFWPGAQDRLGWIVQLAGIVAAAPSPPDEVTLFVVGARGGAGPWTFHARGRSEVQTPLGPVHALHYERLPAVARDQRVEAWLDPARGHWPVKLRLTPVLGGPSLELLLSAEPARP